MNLVSWLRDFWPDSCNDFVIWIASGYTFLWLAICAFAKRTPQPEIPLFPIIAIIMGFALNMILEWAGTVIIGLAFAIFIYFLIYWMVKDFISKPPPPDSPP